ncbi:MAG: hypothetical protein N2378_16160 [Chloroflexaceae bacterium]|nr:hypothetical protein [Chloroflexaceae bacterium]
MAAAVTVLACFRAGPDVAMAVVVGSTIGAALPLLLRRRVLPPPPPRAAAHLAGRHLGGRDLFLAGRLVAWPGGMN